MEKRQTLLQDPGDLEGGPLVESSPKLMLMMEIEVVTACFGCTRGLRVTENRQNPSLD